MKCATELLRKRRMGHDSDVKRCFGLKEGEVGAGVKRGDKTHGNMQK